MADGGGIFYVIFIKIFFYDWPHNITIDNALKYIFLWWFNAVKSKLNHIYVATGRH